MKKFVFTLLLGLILAGCHAQDDRSKSKDDLAEKKTDSTFLEQPKISWKVDKKYDGQGNIIGYDSIYSYSFDNLRNLPRDMNLDSIMGSMRILSQGNLSSFLEDHNMGRFMEMDSLMNGDQFFNDFFERQRSNGFSGMQELFQQMDSLQILMMERHGNLTPDASGEKSKL
jgi:hypothetical protein